MNRRRFVSVVVFAAGSMLLAPAARGAQDSPEVLLRQIRSLDRERAQPGAADFGPALAQLARRAREIDHQNGTSLRFKVAALRQAQPAAGGRERATDNARVGPPAPIRAR